MTGKLLLATFATLAGFVFIVHSIASAQSSTFRNDPIVNGQVNIAKNGEQKGTIRPDPFMRGAYQVRDDRGNLTGYIRKDEFQPGTYNWKPLEGSK